MKSENKRQQAVPLFVRPIQFTAECLGAFPIAITAALYSVSFAVIVYGSSLSQYLEYGILLTLLGSGVAAITTGLLGSLRSAISHAQDATALLLAGAIASTVTAMSDTAPPDVQSGRQVAT